MGGLGGNGGGCVVWSWAGFRTNANLSLVTGGEIAITEHWPMPALRYSAIYQQPQCISGLWPRAAMADYYYDHCEYSIRHVYVVRKLENRAGVFSGASE